jgi:hypothetical protein
VIVKPPETLEELLSIRETIQNMIDNRYSNVAMVKDMMERRNKIDILIEAKKKETSNSAE